MKGYLHCYNCHKPRCFFSRSHNDELDDAFEQWNDNDKSEPVSFCYSCGDLVFDDDHPVSKVIGQRQALTCESPIEKAYYPSDEQALKVPQMCYHCGESGSKNFLLEQEQLE